MDAASARAAVAEVTLLAEIASNWAVLAEPSGLQQVLTNLIHNAVAYAGPGAQIRVTAQAVASPTAVPMVRVAVSDDGVGIAPEHLPRLFERFYRVDPGRSRQQGGTGLGLAIVKHQVEAMGGSVGVRSERGRGAQFWFELAEAEPHDGQR